MRGVTSVDAEQVDNLMKTYRENQGRCAHLITQEKQLQRKIAEAELEARADILYGSHFPLVEKPSTGELVWTPHGNMTGDPTGNAAIKLTEIATESMNELKKKLVTIRSELVKTKELIEYVDDWLMGMNERERWVVSRQVIDGAYWRDILDEARQRIGVDVSQATLKRLRDSGMSKAYRMAA